MRETKRLIGQRIKRLRKLKGLTQEKLAEKAGIDTKHLGSIETARNSTTLKTLNKISVTLGVEIGELFHLRGGDGEINKIHDMIAIASNEQLRMISKVVRAVMQI